MKVELINANEVENLFKSWGEFSCTCYNTPKKFAVKVGESCLNTKHFSGSRAEYLKFNISGVSRACLDQLVRHTVGVTVNMQSGRYVNMDDFQYTTPSTLNNIDEAKAIYDSHMLATKEAYNKIADILKDNGLKGEKVNEIARGVLPMNHHSKLTMGVTIEALINICNKRLCVCSQEEIQQLTRLIKNEVIRVLPQLKPHLVPICVASNYCPESPSRSCGAYPQKDIVTQLVLDWNKSKHNKE